MTRRMGLRGRVLASHLLVVTVVAGVGVATVHLLTPQLFDRGMRGPGAGQGETGRSGGVAADVLRAQIEQAYDDALLTASLVAAAVGLVVAVMLGAVLSRRVLRPVRDAQDATRRLAAGDYGTAIPEPPEPELAELVSSVNHLGAELAATDAARNRLVADLAHELRNPLMTIEGYMEGLIDGVLPPTVETYDEVAKEAQRLRRLTNDLSLLSRADEGALALERKVVDAAQVAQAAATRLHPQFDAARVSLLVEVPDPLPVEADPERLTQIITNLLGNAVAHTPSGGTVVLRGASDGHECRLEVIDDGEGIPVGELEHIFDRFTRLGRGSGTGIGLDISRRLAEAHGGTLVAHSEGPGTGARFVLRLPSAAANR